MNKYLITKLPVTPESSTEKQLCFVAIEEKKSGQFLYDNQTISLIYHQKSSVSYNSGDRSSKKNKPRSLEIPCETYLENFSQAAMEMGITYQEQESGGVKIKKVFSGFEFDLKKNMWRGYWQVNKTMEVFNSCYFDSWKINLELNLVDLTGQYFETESIDRTD